MKKVTSFFQEQKNEEDSIIKIVELCVDDVTALGVKVNEHQDVKHEVEGLYEI